MMDRVLNKHLHGMPPGSVYIGRGSAYGNPYAMRGPDDRDRVVDAYEEMLRRNPDLVRQIRIDIGDRPVVCFCKRPGASIRCHGDVVVGVADMDSRDLERWMAGKVTLRGFDANRMRVSDFLQAQRQVELRQAEVAGVGDGPDLAFVPGRSIVHERDADVLVNLVNCRGVLGAGVAKAFADAFPVYREVHQRDVRSGLFKPGAVVLTPFSSVTRNAGPGSPLYIASMATKDHWRDPSRLEWVDAGLANLASRVREQPDGPRSIAIPPPGCGLGGLDWRDVQPLVLHHLAGFRLKIYGQPADNPRSLDHVLERVSRARAAMATGVGDTAVARERVPDAPAAPGSPAKPAFLAAMARHGSMGR